MHNQVLTGLVYFFYISQQRHDARCFYTWKMHLTKYSENFLRNFAFGKFSFCIDFFNKMKQKVQF